MVAGGGKQKPDFPKIAYDTRVSRELQCELFWVDFSVIIEKCGKRGKKFQITSQYQH